MVIWESQVILYLEAKERAFLASPGAVRRQYNACGSEGLQQGAMTDCDSPKGLLTACTCLGTSAGLVLRKQ